MLTGRSLTAEATLSVETRFKVILSIDSGTVRALDSATSSYYGIQTKSGA